MRILYFGNQLFTSSEHYVLIVKHWKRDSWFLKYHIHKEQKMLLAKYLFKNSKILVAFTINDLKPYTNNTMLIQYPQRKPGATSLEDITPKYL